jgi:hypothetical protein
MPKVNPRRHRSAMLNFRTTPMVARYVKQVADEMHESLSDFIRESIKMRIEIQRTYKEVAEQMGYKDASTLVWHAVQEYAKRHAPVVVTMPQMPEQSEMDLEQEEPA